MVRGVYAAPSNPSKCFCHQPSINGPLAIHHHERETRKSLAHHTVNFFTWAAGAASGFG